MLHPALKKTRKLKKSCPDAAKRVGKRKRLFLFSKFFSFTPTHAARQELPTRQIPANISLKPELFRSQPRLTASMAERWHAQTASQRGRESKK